MVRPENRDDEHPPHLNLGLRHSETHSMGHLFKFFIRFLVLAPKPMADRLQVFFAIYPVSMGLYLGLLVILTGIEVSSQIMAVAYETKISGITYRFLIPQTNQFWTEESSDMIEDEYGAKTVVGSSRMVNSIAKHAINGTDLIGIGLSSCVGRAFLEEKRADNRAVRLVGLLQNVRTKVNETRNPEMPDLGIVYRLNLGRNTNCESVTRNTPIEREQRRLLVVVVIGSRSDKSIQHSFRAALLDAERNLFPGGTRLSEYTQWLTPQLTLLPDQTSITIPSKE